VFDNETAKKICGDSLKAYETRPADTPAYLEKVGSGDDFFGLWFKDHQAEDEANNALFAGNKKEDKIVVDEDTPAAAAEEPGRKKQEVVLQEGEPLQMKLKVAQAKLARKKPCIEEAEEAEEDLAAVGSQSAPEVASEEMWPEIRESSQPDPGGVQ
jgi:hypothetical protein